MTAPPDAAWTLEMVMDLQDRVSNIEQWVTARIGEDMRVCNHARGTTEQMPPGTTKRERRAVGGRGDRAVSESTCK